MWDILWVKYRSDSEEDYLSGEKMEKSEKCFSRKNEIVGRLLNMIREMMQKVDHQVHGNFKFQIWYTNRWTTHHDDDDFAGNAIMKFFFKYMMTNSYFFHVWNLNITVRYWKLLYFQNIYDLHLRIMTLSSSQMKILPNKFSFVLLLCNTLRYAEVSQVTSNFRLDEVYVAVRHVTLSWVRLGLTRLRHVLSSQVYATSSQFGTLSLC